MINLCFLSGTIKNKIDFKFIYNSNTKSLSKKHTSIVLLDLEIEKGQIVRGYAYDEIADWIYRNLQQGNFISIQGRITQNGVEIEEVKKLV
ncbi:MAG: hypothetical protein HFJ30_03690 [Clostridia bacterium]|jgi:hypothetical protein|nr:hypothetical protein [Clostridia bacterium]MCI9413153.1 hypothetical protein [Clostridia bacterium]